MADRLPVQPAVDTHLCLHTLRQLMETSHIIRPRLPLRSEIIYRRTVLVLKMAKCIEQALDLLMQ